MASKISARHRKRAEATAKLQRDIQRRVDRRRPKKAKAKQPRVARIVAQHLMKPGKESELRPAPAFAAPDYRGSGKLEGKVALITGGDSGIGRAVAVLFAREGADVAVLYLNEHDDADETCRRVRQEGTRAIAISGDVRDPGFCAASVEQVLAEFGKLDVLVNNAAFQLHATRIEDLDDEHFDMTIRTNLYGYFQMARAAVPHLGREGCIINTGSETGLFGAPGLVDYASTKGAIHALTKSLATQLAPRGIRVNVVAPGPVWTPLNPADRPAAEVPSFGKTTDQKRPAQPEEIAPAYVFLASPACSSYITGIELPIMGGVRGSG